MLRGQTRDKNRFSNKNRYFLENRITVNFIGGPFSIYFYSLSPLWQPPVRNVSNIERCTCLKYKDKKNKYKNVDEKLV